MTKHPALHRGYQARREYVYIAHAIAVTLLLILLGTPQPGKAISSQHTAFLSSRIPETFVPQERRQVHVELSKGKFLVASRQVRDPRFMETVILLIKYDWHGAMGLVINRPTEVRLSTVFPEIKGLKQRTRYIYLGGPVAINKMQFLMRSGSQIEESLWVFDDVYVSSSRTVLERMINDINAEAKFRVYAGYAGWTSEQLEREILRGDWDIVQSDAETVFDKAPSEIWPELIRRTSAIQVKMQRKD